MARSRRVRHDRTMLRRLRWLIAFERRSFAFETTLASRTFAPMLVRWKAAGYVVHVVLLLLPTADLAIARVRERVLLRGHGVPVSTIETIARRHARGVRNFIERCRPLADSWRVLDDSGARPRLVAEGMGASESVRQPERWQRLLETAR